MKCDIILDLLPLYIEDLCRPESKKAVTEHLAGCVSCQKEYQKLLEELLPDHFEDGETERYLEERDLFQKSKTAVRESLLAHGSRIAEIIVFITALLCNIGMFFIVVKGYYLRYPALRLEEPAACLWILLLPLLPTAVSLTGLLISYYNTKFRKHSRALCIASRTSLWLLAPSILIGGLFTVIFVIVPPLYSHTDNPGHYMAVDRDMEFCRDTLLELFPEEIPEQAENISYHYQKYSALFSDTMAVECTFTLPDEAYQELKDASLSARCFKQSQSAGMAADETAGAPAGSKTVTAAVLPEGVNLTFSFDDASRSVCYRAELDKSN